MISLRCLSLVFTLSLTLVSINGLGETERKPYIVYMGNAPKIGTLAVHDHHNLLISAIGDTKVAMESRIHSYRKSFNAFAARLLPHEVDKLKGMEGVVSVFPSTKRKLHTTRSWDFIGMLPNVKRKIAVESNIIIGLLDTGAYTASPSFNDKGFGPPPAKWKGSCAKKDANFTGCNNKIIGAKYFRLEQSETPVSPVDTEGHGTHTASTAGGITVPHASFLGLGEGLARGGAPSARVAMYKVCWDEGCSDVDMLAAFDDAISDGVDIISISIGGPPAQYFDDCIAIGAFHAMQKGILTASSGGNDGPSPGTVTNVAPWIFTIGASSIDRQFQTVVKLGNGKTAAGISLNTFSPKKSMYPLTSGALIANNSGSAYGSPGSCDYGTLDTTKAKGKIIYCTPGTGGQDYSVQQSGGTGTIVQADAVQDSAFSYVIPAVYVAAKVGDMVDQYINSTKNAQAVIEKTVPVKIPAPFIASFSSRGPNSISANILKPDVCAPGVDIVAAWSRFAPITSYDTDNRVTDYNIISGTSMACPHVAGAAAYVKSFRPAWSPAAIKSALMTTATGMRVRANENVNVMDYGSGQIDPVRAVHAGLVYDLNEKSYIAFLCKEGFNGTILSKVTGAHKVDCSLYHTRGSDGLNYPSMTLEMAEPSSPISATFHRVVTNVGLAKSVYKAKVTSPKGLSISVMPNVLSFRKIHEKKPFKVQVSGSLGNTGLLSGLLEWTSDSGHSVRSPVVVYHYSAE